VPFGPHLDSDSVDHFVAEFDPDDYEAGQHLRPPPLHQEHSPLIILGGVLALALGLTVWAGLLLSLAGSFPNYVNDGIGNLAAPLPGIGGATVTQACGASDADPASDVPCETPRQLSAKPAQSSAKDATTCREAGNASDLLSRAGVWFASGCSRG
jgi:hypothetical protein